MIALAQGTPDAERMAQDCATREHADSRHSRGRVVDDAYVVSAAEDAIT